MSTSSMSRAVPPVNPVGAARGGTQEDLRRHNLATVLTLLHNQGALSRARLTELVGLNRSTIAGLVSELADLGAVHERHPGTTQTGAGRPSLMVVPNRSAAEVLAVAIGVDRVVAARVGLTGYVSARRRRTLGRTRSVATVVRLICQLFDELVQDDPGGHIAGLVVSIPGVVRQSDGLVRLAPNLSWVDEPLGEQLRAAFEGLPVWWGNDADLGLLGEHRRGAAVGVDDVVFLAGEVGVGGAIIVSGRSLIGAGGYAGELGHMLIRPKGRRCRCGAHGCWETEIGARAIARGLGLPERTPTDDLVEVLANPGPRASEDLAEVARYLGQGLSVVVNTVNPRLVVIGGLLARVYPLIAETVREHLNYNALVAPREQVEITVPQLGDDATLIGAAELAWADLLLDPVALLAEHH